MFKIERKSIAEIVITIILQIVTIVVTFKVLYVTNKNSVDNITYSNSINTISEYSKQLANNDKSSNAIRIGIEQYNTQINDNSKYSISKKTFEEIDKAYTEKFDDIKIDFKRCMPDAFNPNLTSRSITDMLNIITRENVNSCLDIMKNEIDSVTECIINDKCPSDIVYDDGIRSFLYVIYCIDSLYDNPGTKEKINEIINTINNNKKIKSTFNIGALSEYRILNIQRSLTK